MNYSAEKLFSLAPVIPVITLEDPDGAVPLARALLEGGLPVMEITLRTRQGLEAIRRIRAQVEGAIVGAGTVLDPTDLGNAIAAGSQFIVTPGVTPALLEAGASCGVPLVPGVATVSEIMVCRDAGYTALKFFPAEANGGAAALRAFGGPVPDVSFCPTGGVEPENLADYLAVPSVGTVGGSWITPAKRLAEGDWSGIAALASGARDLVASIRSGFATGQQQ